jgi:hypothetical protein
VYSLVASVPPASTEVEVPKAGLVTPTVYASEKTLTTSIASLTGGDGAADGTTLKLAVVDVAANVPSETCEAVIIADPIDPTCI